MKKEKRTYTRVIARCRPLDNGSMPMHLCPYGEEIHGHRPSVVTFTDYLKAKIGEELVDVVAKGLPMEANDIDFLQCLRDCKNDIELAVDVYCSEFGIDRNGVELDPNAPKPKKGKK